MSRRFYKIALGLYFFSQVLFLINIQFPKGHNFDEFHYVPSAKQFLELKQNQNWEHPPLGKLLMAVGIQIWGDRPIGWRFMSTLFGSVTLVGMYFLAFVLFESETLALWVALLTLTNHLLYVQARIGMLDTFMFTFVVWGMVSFCSTWNPLLSVQHSRKLFSWTGLMLGLGIACKWFVVIPWAACSLLFIGVRILQNWQVQFKHPTVDDWYSPNLWRGYLWRYWVIDFGLIPVGVYGLTFIPFFFIPGGPRSLGQLIRMQVQMWEGQLRVVNSHPYMSHWIDWPLLTRPIWYAFDREGSLAVWVRGVLLLGNPLIMWTGLIALGFCLRDWILHRSRNSFLILFFYFVFYACWAVIPRKISFYYYYYPAGMTLSLALASLFHRNTSSKWGKIFNTPWVRWVFLSAAFGVFVYFFPILAALKIPAESFRNWMWFQSWI